MKLVIFNQDLRISDNPALFFACEKSNQDGQEILPIFILDEVNQRNIGGASKWFLHSALKHLQKDLQEKLGLKLLIFRGDSLQILTELFSKVAVKEIYFNRLYEPDSIKLQSEIKNSAADKNIQVFDFKSYLLFEPEEIKNGSGTYFKVFTPFWKSCLQNWELVSEPLPIPSNNDFNVSDSKLESNQTKPNALPTTKLLDLDLLPSNPNWAKEFEKIWHFDRATITKNFQHFLKNHLKDYKENRNFPAISGTSKLSAYLHFGLISVSEVVFLVKEHHLKNPEDKAGTAHFLSEIGWREFSYNLLFHFPELPQKNFKTEFNNFTWDNKPEQLKKWQKGQTGYPIVDAAMQELWQTGFMHNRTRMIVASFLIKDLFIDWQFGEKWFWDCLVDANLANNAASWQWVAGSGADAAPYFRIFNPILQSEKFDPNGEYIKKYLPQLKNLPTKFIHKPWELSTAELKQYGVELGKNYPRRIVLHEEARNKALSIYKSLP